MTVGPNSYTANNLIAQYDTPEGIVEFHGIAGGITVFLGERMVQKDLGLREFACYMAHCLQAAHHKRIDGPNSGLEWLETQDFYELCQSYRHAQDVMPVAPGLPTAGEAFERLKLSIADAFCPLCATNERTSKNVPQMVSEAIGQAQSLVRYAKENPGFIPETVCTSRELLMSKAILALYADNMMLGAPPSAKNALGAAPRWVTSWPNWHGIPGNTEVVPSSDYDALLKTHLELVGQFNGAIKMLQEANEVCRSASSIAERDGKDTEWDSFRYRLQKVLEAQHVALYPSASTDGTTAKCKYNRRDGCCCEVCRPDL